MDTAHALARHPVLSTAPHCDCDFGSGPLCGNNAGISSLEKFCCYDGVLAQGFDASSQISVDVPVSCGFRFGEADHPGPDGTGLLRVGVTNLSGLRMKEDVAVEMNEGIFTFCETQLSRFTQGSCGRRLKQVAAAQGRILRTHFGAPAPVRSTSEWAGSWTGIATTSDHPSKELRLPWKSDEYLSGRVLATQHFVNGLPFLNVGVYGFAKSPTWPHAAAMTEEILETITAEVVYGADGPRIICGDFNESPMGLETFSTWRMLGWQSAQQWAESVWGQQVIPTCKGATEVDQVWLSPEAMELCQRVEVEQHFAEHATVVVTLTVPTMRPLRRQWCKPSPIPWQKVDASWPKRAAKPLADTSLGGDRVYSMWAHDFEQSLGGHLHGQPADDLIPNQRGRARQLRPVSTRENVTCLRPSRAGEVQCRSDFLGEATKRWFQQLRRLQSFRHAAVAAKMSPEAQLYRAELWTSIRKARGFVPSFPVWWASHCDGAGCGCPLSFPVGPPTGEIAELIFRRFKELYEKFESWHLRQRTQLIKNKHDRTLKALHKDLRAPAKQQVDMFWDTNIYQILEADADTKQLLLDKPLCLKGHSRWFVDDFPVQVLSDHSDVCTVVPFPFVGPDSVLIQKQTLSCVEEISSYAP